IESKCLPRSSTGSSSCACLSRPTTTPPTLPGWTRHCAAPWGSPEGVLYSARFLRPTKGENDTTCPFRSSYGIDLRRARRRRCAGRLPAQAAGVDPARDCARARDADRRLRHARVPDLDPDREHLATRAAHAARGARDRHHLSSFIETAARWAAVSPCLP